LNFGRDATSDGQAIQTGHVRGDWSRRAHDDSVTYALQCSHVLPRVFLFGTYAWNKLPAAIKSLPSNVMRCNDWETVKRELEAWTPPAPAQQQPSGAADA
jgi:hypothetical protein